MPTGELGRCLVVERRAPACLLQRAMIARFAASYLQKERGWGVVRGWQSDPTPKSREETRPMRGAGPFCNGSMTGVKGVDGGFGISYSYFYESFCHGKEAYIFHRRKRKAALGAEVADTLA